jgi:ferric-dicitrate binding protein FerR (iron transport regulator)
MDTAFDLPEDFAADESFVNYCFQSNEGDMLFWEKWLRGHPEKRKNAEKGRDLVFLMGIGLAPEDKQDAFKKLEIKLPFHDEDLPEYIAEARKSRIKPYLITGVLLVLAGGFFWRMSVHKGGTNGSGRTKRFATAYAAIPGEKRNIVLHDGTHILLNALSRLSVDPDFEKNTREVTLSGEAFFTVAGNADKPFIIHTDNMDITVLGTALNVKDYPGDKKAEAALISGSVAVKLHNDTTKKIILKPDEKIISYKHTAQLPPVIPGETLQINAGNIAKGFSISSLKKDPLLDSGTVATAWIENKLVFRDEPFEELAAQMARKYGVQFHFSSNALRQYRFTGIFSKETITEALQALKLTSPSDPFDFSVKGKDIYISKK